MTTDAGPTEASSHPRSFLGPNLRAIRLARSRTLAQVAGSAGISESWLSQIERGRSVPSVDILHNLASALGLPFHDLFEPPQDKRLRPLSESDRPRIDWGEGGAYKTLVTSRTDTAVDVFVGHFPPGASTGDAYVHGDASEVLLVLSGTVTVTIDGDEFVMNTGQSLEYRTSTPHRARNLSDAAASVLWVVSPPTGGSPTIRGTESDEASARIAPTP